MVWLGFIFDDLLLIIYEMRVSRQLVFFVVVCMLMNDFIRQFKVKDGCIIGEINIIDDEYCII